MKVFSSTSVCGVLRAVEKDPVIVIAFDGPSVLPRTTCIGVLELYFGDLWLDEMFDTVSPI